MYNNESEKYLKSHQPLEAIDIMSYKDVIGLPKIERLQQVAHLLENKKWFHVNSTFEGGGVAEMLKSVVPIVKGLGVDAKWYSIEGNDQFYSITKRFHNIIQGVNQEFTLEDLFETYIKTNKQNFKDEVLEADFTVVHDPQPCASIVHGDYKSKMVWRCHIDTSEANEMIWNFLLPYINNYDASIFSMHNFVKDGIKKPVYQIVPAIDPLCKKNRQRTKQEALDNLADLFNEHNIDPERPIVLAVSRYDVHKNQKTIVDAFKKLKVDSEVKQLNPQLIIVGNAATDDPEGMHMYQEILDEIDGDPDIYPLLNIPDNDENIGCLMKLASVFIHVSTKEGFGLVVTEALWQGTPVIGSRVGGIVLQVIDGKTGFLVEPFDIDRIIGFAKHMLMNKDDCERMGIAAVEHVRENFLITTLIEKYMLLMRFELGIDFPYFRI